MTFNYYSWDSYKTRGCVCDPEYGDVDCSKRMCQFGNDVMDHRDDLIAAKKYQTQSIQFTAATTSLSDLELKTFALTFKSQLNETFTTLPIRFFDSAANLHEFVLDVELALEMLPNRVIDDVEVAASYSGNTAYLNVTFVGENVQGPQNLIMVRDMLCGDGCSPQITGLDLQINSNNVTELSLADFNSYECGRRGKCDYTTGLCNCFAGYSGLSCSTISCLV